MYRKICVTNRALAERPFLEQLACVLATKPYAMILREKDLTEEAYEELAGKVKKLCENTDTRLILHSFPDAAMHLGVRPFICRCIGLWRCRKNKSRNFQCAVSPYIRWRMRAWQNNVGQPI